MIARIPLPKGPANQLPDRIVVHAMAEYITHEGREYHAVDYLRMLGLSAHSLITPSGVRIRCRRENQGAWHAKGYNTNSLGVEVLVPGVHDYESFLDFIQHDYMMPSQYEAVVDQALDWIGDYDILHIDRHSDIDPTRKKDPGDGFPWNRFLLDIGWKL